MVIGDIKRNSRDFFRRPRIKRVIKKQVRKSDSILFGAQSINAQLDPPLRRETIDFDIFARKPKKFARKLERNLDKAFGGDFFFTKPALHKGTTKVVHEGFDNRKNTKDDFTVADVSAFPRPVPRTKKVDGIRVVSLGFTAKTKLKAIRDPEFKFRRTKDQSDLDRIRIQQRLNRSKI